MKRILAILLAAVLAIGFFSIAASASPEPKPTTAWNVLTLIFLNVDVIVPDRPGRIIDSLNQDDVNHLIEVTSMIKESIPSISGSLMSIDQMDFVTIAEPIRVLNAGWNHMNHYVISDILDAHLAAGDYDHMILIAPLSQVANGWLGLGGMAYRNVGVSQVQHRSGNTLGAASEPPFPDAIFVHEMLHDIERRSRAIKPNTASLHDNALFGFPTAADEWRAWYTAYMRNSPEMNGRGIDPQAYVVQRGAAPSTITTLIQDINIIFQTVLSWLSYGFNLVVWFFRF